MNSKTARILRMSKSFARVTWRVTKAASLMIADGIIALSLMQKGERPKPGKRTSWPPGLRNDLLKRQRGYCVYCRRRLRRIQSHIDHILPVNQGGSNEPDNLQLLCAGCNVRKSDRTDAEFRSRYRDLLPQQRGRMPRRYIRQSQFRAVTKATRDTESYTRFKGGVYLTAAQKVNAGALMTGAVVTGLIFLPISMVANVPDAATLFIASLGVGAAAGVGVRLRAWYTGKDQEV